MRTWQAERCPACEGEALIHLGEGAAQALVLDAARRARAALTERRRSELQKLRDGGWTIELYPALFHRLMVLSGYTIVWGGIVMVLGMLGVPRSSGWLLLAPPLAALGATELWVRVKAKRLAAMPERLIPIHRAPRGALAAPAIVTARVTGLVRAICAHESPVTATPCVAFRVTGSAGAHQVDDAGGAAFDVIHGDGRTRIEIDHARIELPVGAPAVVDPGEALRAFLAGRGVRIEGDEVWVAEAVLVDGDEVEVEGQVDQLGQAEGYRGSRFVEVLRGTAGAPVVIRKLASRPPDTA